MQIFEEACYEIAKEMTVPKTFEEAVRLVALEIAQLCINKQKDYGKQNIMEFGEFGVLVRSNDKFARLKNLILNNKEALNEPKIDGWKDVVGYGLIALLLDRGWFELPLEK